jgi:translation initiation factor IF-3
VGKIKRAVNKSTRKEVRINERIRVPQVRLIDEAGQMLGVVNTRDAMEAARERGYDLVMVSPNASPPVCRIMDYGKYKYEQSKKARKAKKKQHVVHVKEVKMRPGIEQHDYDFKMNHARRFLEHNDKVKFSLIFRGREVTHLDIGQRVMERVAKDLEGIATVEVRPKREGNALIMIVAPKPGFAKKPVEKAKDSGEEEDAKD